MVARRVWPATLETAEYIWRVSSGGYELLKRNKYKKLGDFIPVWVLVLLEINFNRLRRILKRLHSNLQRPC